MRVRRILILCQLAGSPLLAAQEGPHTARPVLAWVSAGVGGGTQGFAAAAGADLLLSRHLISFRTAGVANIFEDGFWDFAILYGRAGRWSHGLVALSAGLAVMDGERCGGGIGSSCVPLAARISLPLAGRVAWHALPNLGVGLYGFANLNGERSFAGAVAAVELGRLR